jgi:hypothetical protein
VPSPEAIILWPSFGLTTFSGHDGQICNKGWDRGAKWRSGPEKKC